MSHEPEIDALSEVYEAFKELERPQIRRILNWISSRFGLTGETVPEPAAFSEHESKTPIVETGNNSYEPVEVKDIETEGLNESDVSGEPEDIAKIPEKSVIDNQQATHNLTQSPLTTEEDSIPDSKIDILEDFLKYESFEELFLFSNTKTLDSKILLTAAYLQEKENNNGLSSHDISFALNELGEEIANPSEIIEGLLDMRPPLLMPVIDDESNNSEIKFKVTNAGLRLVRSYIKQ